MRANLLVLISFISAGCVGEAPTMTGGGGGGGGELVDPDAPHFAELLKGEAQLKALCARNYQDAVSRGLCAKPAPTIKSIADLERVVGLFNEGPPQFALTGHSTSLVARSVSALNPRAIIFTVPSGQPTTQPNDGSFIKDPGFVTLGFARGEQLVELAAHDPQRNELHFYLVRFTQECNRAGCTPGDLFTPAVESGWTSTTVYEDADIKNTVFDCQHCHQAGGPQTKKILRMQERRAPWTHWFRNNRNEPGGISLVADFKRAHGESEDYAGIPGGLIDTPQSDPLVLEALVSNNTVSPQPNEFDTIRIEQQVQQSAPQQPEVNNPMGRSTTWSTAFQRAVRGEAIPVPYHDVKVTDAGKLDTLTNAYRAVASGQMARASLPDLRNVFLDDGMADMGFRPAPGLDGAGILTQMCARCHNPSLDQTISRARFDATRLGSMSRDEKDKAIARLLMAPASHEHMPPERFGTLSASEAQAAVEELRK